ncbi:MAG: DUF1553 domain-containing protein, partial [Planctomycetota bacterium]|nr:DUF1553 domain-containing protein [Planctomycetota bacterium]
YPSMTTFDAPSREFCTLRRSQTNTPLQALVTLNDPVFVNAARSLARSTLRFSPEDDARLVFLFRRVLIRPPQQKEILFLKSMLSKIKSNLSDADSRDLVGMAKNLTLEDNEFASWIVICNVVLNLDETLARP